MLKLFSQIFKGGHINPAVSLAQAVIGRFPWKKVPAYMVAQYCGSFCASFFVFIIYYGKFMDLKIVCVKSYLKCEQLFAFYFKSKFPSSTQQYLEQKSIVQLM